MVRGCTAAASAFGTVVIKASRSSTIRLDSPGKNLRLCLGGINAPEIRVVLGGIEARCALAPLIRACRSPATPWTWTATVALWCGLRRLRPPETLRQPQHKPMFASLAVDGNPAVTDLDKKPPSRFLFRPSPFGFDQG